MCLPVAGCAPAPSDTTAGQASGQVIRVIDGDTLDVTRTLDSARLRLRLVGVDAPETSHDGVAPACGADAATAELRRLTEAGAVTWAYDPASDQTDRFGRHLVYLATDTDADVADALTRAGRVTAWYPAGGPTPRRYLTYRANELHAQAMHAGSWTTCTTLGRR